MTNAIDNTGFVKQSNQWQRTKSELMGFNPQITLRASMYSVFLKDWIKVFKRENVLVIKSEDYYANRTATLNEIYTFIGLGKPTSM
jgi:hypothetical protein